MAERKSKKIGALWLRQSVKDGKKTGYMTGVVDLGALGEIQIAVFKNTRKEKESQPDYNIAMYLESAPQQERQPGEDDDSAIPF